jgi:outer membrane lipoprotein-sorting protein
MRIPLKNSALVESCGILLFCLTLLFAVLGFAAPQEDIDPREIIDRIDQILRGESSHAVATMSIVTKRWERQKTLEMWSEGTDKFLVKVLKPEKEEGVATLKVGTDIWNYLPKIDRTIRIPSSMMSASWMGSHFSNDDLVKESRLVRDYEIELVFNGERDGRAVYEFKLIPKPEAPVVWGRIEYLVRQDDLMPLWAKYFDEDNNLKRTMTFSEFKKLGSRLVPTRMLLQPEDEPNEYTEVLYESAEFDIQLPPSTFSLSALRSRR